MCKESDRFVERDLFDATDCSIDVFFELVEDSIAVNVFSQMINEDIQQFGQLSRLASVFSFVEYSEDIIINIEIQTHFIYCDLELSEISDVFVVYLSDLVGENGFFG